MATPKSNNASKQVTTAAQAATTKLSKQTDVLMKIVTDLQKSNESYEDLVTNIELKQGEIDNLTTEFEERQREMEADLKIRQKESASSLVQEILRSENKVSIDSSEYTSMTNELETVKADFSKNVKSETEKAVAIVSNRHASEIRGKELEFVAESATMKAELNTTKEKIETLTGQVNDYKTQIASDREARVQEAQARGGQTIAIQSDNKR